MPITSKSHVLLVCPEPLGHRQPAGVGIRFLELAKLLRAEGHDVTLLSRDGAAIEGFDTGGLDATTIRAASEACDAIVVQGHVANEVFEFAAEKPVVVDLYDPWIIENLHYAKDGYETFAHDHATLVRSLQHGDFFLCASEIQRTFYLGLFLALGRLNPGRFFDDPEMRTLVDLVPFGVPEPLPDDDAPRPPALLFGGIYDWYDPSIAVEAIAIARDRVPDLTLTFTTHPNAELTPQGVFERTRDLVRKRGWESFVRFDPWVPYEDRAGHYAGFAGALVTFRPSIETSLAMRTRVFDFLWGGLPVITSSSPGTDAVLRQFNAGTIIETNQPEDFASSVVDLVRDDALRRGLVEGSRRLTRAHQWSRLAQPLVRFLENPRIDGTKTSFRTVDRDLVTPTASIWSRVKRKLGGER